jgi:hypothetical protein
VALPDAGVPSAIPVPNDFKDDAVTVDDKVAPVMFPAATLPADPVVFWFNVGTSPDCIADIVTCVPSPRAYMPETTDPATASSAACCVVWPVPPRAKGHTVL